MSKLRLDLEHIRSHLKCIGLVYSTEIAAMSVWWMWNLPFQAIQIAFSLFLFKLLEVALGGSNSLYGGNFVAFIISGLMVNTYLDTALSGWYDALSSIYRGKFATGGVTLSMRDYLYLAGIPPSLYLFAKVSWNFIMATSLFLSYLFLGTFFFGFKLPPHVDYVSLTLLLAIGVVACSGLGLISASMYWIAGAYRGVEPIRFFIRLLVPLVSGIYIPIEILPYELRLVGLLLPHTYVIMGARKVLFKGLGLPFVAGELHVLMLQALVLIPIGVVLLRFSLELERKRGTIY